MVKEQEECMKDSQKKMKQREVEFVVRGYKESKCLNDTVLWVNINMEMGRMVWRLELDRDMCGDVMNIGPNFWMSGKNHYAEGFIWNGVIDIDLIGIHYNLSNL